MRRAAWVVVTAVLAAGVPVEARLEADPPVVDFGTVEQGARVTRQFVVENKSRSPVRIERLVPSCACTVAMPAGESIGPRGRMALSVTLDTTDLVGKTTKTIIIQTSDRQTPSVQLALRGTVLADLMATPTAVYLGRVWRTEPIRREVIVGPGRPSGTRFTVTSVETESSVLRARVEPGPKEGQQKVIIELGAEPPSGRFNDEVVIRTTSPRQPIIRVPVFGQII
jgi:hypothetical protein